MFCSKHPLHRTSVLSLKLIRQDYQKFINDSLQMLLVKVKPFTPMSPQSDFSTTYSSLLPGPCHPFSQQATVPHDATLPGCKDRANTLTPDARALDESNKFAIETAGDGAIRQLGNDYCATGSESVATSTIHNQAQPPANPWHHSRVIKPSSMLGHHPPPKKLNLLFCWF